MHLILVNEQGHFMFIFFLISIDEEIKYKTLDGESVNFGPWDVNVLKNHIENGVSDIVLLIICYWRYLI
jgi:hypothetical protein